MNAASISVRNTVGHLCEALRAVTWAHIGWTALIGLLGTVLLSTVSHAIGVILFQSWSQRGTSFALNLFVFEVCAFTFMACVLAADQAVRCGAPRTRAYLIAVILASALAAVVDTPIRIFAGNFDTFQPWWKLVHTVSTFMWALLVGGLATFVYADLKRNRETAARLHAATLQRTKAARDVLQTRLQAMQARVEPQFLFDTLDRIGEIYDHEPAKGEQTIDNLIVYLRTAMPQMHDSASTLARELELVRTYAAIVTACSDDRVHLTIEAHGDWTGTAFPPMLLLPLVEHAIARSRLTRADDGAMDLRAVRIEDSVQVTLAHGGDAFTTAESAAVTRVRERMHTLFEDTARLEPRVRADRGTEIVMEIPT